ncbi:cysteine hydrolase [Thalassospira sp. TSL5-1]|uniref:cysteine hydrolase n=1 Tax=Thalassospira sp. TSL5-1 TaxID=1544451 RepID=UPI00093DB4AC|nr:cysteine hydrolase [Thalassospira sp. TSL5-1]
MWPAVLLAILLLAGIIGYTIYGYRRHLESTTGQKIDLNARPNSALLIIDLQEDFTKATGKNAYDPVLIKNAIAAINDLVTLANQNGHPVISVRQTFSGWYMNLLVKLLNNGRGGPKSDGLDIDTRLDGDIDHDIVKSCADAFREPELEKALVQQKVGKLTIVGLDGNYCVNSTINAALNRGYDVSFSDAATLAISPANWQKAKSHLLARGAHDITSGNVAAGQSRKTA